MSEYINIYDIVVAKGHLLRRIREEIDFSFVNPLLKSSYCEHLGRPAKEPEMMFKILFLKKLYDISDEQLIEQIRVNMAYKFFLDMLPEDEPVDSSLLTKFRKTRITQDILDDMLKETVRQAIDKGLVKSTAIIVDSTHTQARYKQQSPTQMLRKLSKDLRKEIYTTDYDLSNDFPEKPAMTAELDEEIAYTKALLKAVSSGILKSNNKKSKKILAEIESLLKDDKIKGMTSACDEDAKIGHKSKEDTFFGFKNHIAMTEERIITALKVTDGSTDDGKQLPELISTSRENGVKVDEVVGDTAFCRKDNLELAKDEENGFKLISKLHPIVAESHTKERDGVVYNKDADTYICSAGEAASCTKYHNKKENKTVLTFSFSLVNCKKCPQKDICKLSKTRSFSVTIPKEIHKNQLDFQKSDYFKDRYKQRYKIEAKNAEAKRYHGLETADSKGTQAMSVQSFFTAFALNIKRIVKLTNPKSKARA
jgi:transposase